MLPKPNIPHDPGEKVEENGSQKEVTSEIEMKKIRINPVQFRGVILYCRNSLTRDFFTWVWLPRHKGISKQLTKQGLDLTKPLEVDDRKQVYKVDYGTGNGAEDTQIFMRIAKGKVLYLYLPGSCVISYFLYFF